jgi:ribosomal protein S27E
MAVQCPKCKSEQVIAGRKGFGVGKAAAGALLVGPFGLAAGVFGRKKVMVSCMACGHTWQAGKS